MSDRDELTSSLIVGAGPVGLTAALSAQRLGLPTRLIERSTVRHRHPKAVVLWPRALEVLDRLGIADDIVAAGQPLHGQNYSSAGKRIATVSFGKIADSKYSYALAIPQHETERILAETYLARGGRIEYGSELLALSDRTDGVDVTIRGQSGEETACFRWLIGADGHRSTVREKLAIAFEGETYGARFMLSDGPCELPLDRTHAHYFMGKQGVVVAVPMPNDQWRIFANAPAELEEITPAQVEQTVADRLPVPITFRSGHTAGLFQIHRKSAPNLMRSSSFIVGDAAHVHSPAGGQGLNTGFEDAASLMWRLAVITQGGYADLKEWETERGSVIEAVLHDTDLQTRLWSVRGRQARLRDLTLRAATATGVLDRFVAPRQAMLNTRYPSRTPRHIGRLKTGGRLPSIALDKSSPTTLHDLLDAHAATTITFDPKKVLVTSAAVDPNDRTDERSYPATASMFGSLRITKPVRVQVRPDGIVTEVTRHRRNETPAERTELR
ncbi:MULTISPECIES: FAD-dependent monooxygenase [Nocardiaceae]|uniref:FAD-dependent monooxygenase n=1 Tax=Nocardiaceae TaxID=85025 RepID=UPI000A998E3F|nr:MULTISPECIES: FAD-dependent monooxygenase [Rhodococcus]